MNKKNITWQTYKIKKIDREKIHGHKSAVLWFTGLSGSGKSTIANELEVILNYRGISTYILDGDNLRYGLCCDLNFSDKHRKENIRRTGEIGKIMTDAGILVLITLISPFIEDRKIARNIIKPNKFFEIFIDTPINICENRDIKGLYKKARSGQIKNFTGINSKYENPKNAEIYLNGTQPIKKLVNQILFFLSNQKIF